VSVVTDVVFVCSDQVIAERYQEIVHTLYTRMEDYTPYPVTDNGPAISGVIVFHNGYNYADSALLHALRTEPWPPETMLWIEGENDMTPEIRVGTLFVREANRETW
jgi:hypothetical protein